MRKNRQIPKTTPEEWARQRANQDRLERIIQRRLSQEDPEAASRREALVRAAGSSGREARAAQRALWRETEERMERILGRIGAEEAAPLAAAEGREQAGEEQERSSE